MRAFTTDVSWEHPHVPTSTAHCRTAAAVEAPHSPSRPLLLALTPPARLMCSHGSLAQFWNSCSMATWRTCSSDSSESFSCTAAVSSSNTSVGGGETAGVSSGATHTPNHTHSGWAEVTYSESGAAAGRWPGGDPPGSFCTLKGKECFNESQQTHLAWLTCGFHTPELSHTHIKATTVFPQTLSSAFVFAEPDVNECVSICC